ncbi:unnamed protein product [Effrenium voratum]|nr:unnamed protein product [Effrenium voratum]
MESLQRLASLPLVDNACASRANRDSWTYSVFCREILATGAEDPDARRVSDGVYVKVKEVTTAELLNCGPSSAAITAYSEWRSKFSEGQYMTLLFYHAFMFLEVEGGLAICTEKYNDKLELMFGDLQLVRSYGRCYRATGEQRRPSLQHSHCKVERYVTLRELVDWISGPLAIVWRPYCLINSNCQHYARDVVQFLSDERCAETLRGDREVVLSAVQCEGIRLQYASEKLRDDRSLVLAAVQRDGRALAFASPRLRADRALALAAVAQTGLALQFCDRHQEDEELVMTAVMQNARALQFASAALKRSAAVVRAAGGDWRRVFDCPSLANDEDVALTAISLDWEAAHLISEKLRSDMHFMRRAVGLNGLVLQLAVRLQGCRPAVLAALRQDGLALRFASEELRGDLKVVREAVANNPMALEFASEAGESPRAHLIPILGPALVLAVKQKLDFVQATPPSDEAYEA